MKRCPECGFRANDTTCPLCGVKMRGTAAPIQTHTHAQQGERCVLPNQKKGTGAPDPKAEQAYKPEQTSSQRHRREKPSFGVAVFLIIMFILLRSCAWL